MITIAVVNESSVLTDERVIAITAACQTQLVRDLAPAWALPDPEIVLGFVPKGETPPPDAWMCAVLDDSDQANALGYHELTARFQPLAKCFAGSDLEDGCEPSVTVSHELCEMVVDPHLENAVNSPDGERSYLKEACDPCEADALGYLIDGVLVSDFTHPAYWDPASAAGSRFDQQGKITAPYQILRGGYLAYYLRGHGWVQDFSGQHRNMGARFAGKSRFLLGQTERARRRPSTRWHDEVD